MVLYTITTVNQYHGRTYEVLPVPTLHVKCYDEYLCRAMLSDVELVVTVVRPVTAFLLRTEV